MFLEYLLINYFRKYLIPLFFFHKKILKLFLKSIHPLTFHYNQSEVHVKAMSVNVGFPKREEQILQLL